MPRYNVSLTRTLVLRADVAVRARNEEAAQARVKELISKGHFGVIAWQITSQSSAYWEEQEAEIEIDSSTCEVRGRIVHWQASEWPVLRPYTLSLASQIFQVLLDVLREE